MKQQHWYEVSEDGPDRYLIHIPSVGPDAYTQARTVDEIHAMALDYIAAVRNIPESQIEITSTTWHLDVFEVLRVTR